MTANRLAAPFEAVPPATPTRPYRIGVVADYEEEGWRSMDLVAELETLAQNTFCSDVFSAKQIRPSFHRRLSQLPAPGGLHARFNADRLLNRFGDYPLYLRQRRSQFNLFHITDHSYAQLVHVLRPAPTVVTCHDLELFRCLVGLESRPRWFQKMAGIVLAGMKAASHVICVSETVGQELLQYGLIDKLRLSCVPNAVHPDFSQEDHTQADLQAAELLARAGHRQPTAILLNVGSGVPRKQLDVLLKIVAQLKDFGHDVCLVRVGAVLDADLRQLAQELDIEQSVLEFPYVERGVLAALYRRAALLLQTSRYEGFGLPLIEAMACGCPALASDLQVFNEVAGAAATYCAVSDVIGFTQAAAYLLLERSQQPERWEQRKTLCLQRAGRFGLESHARQVARIYRAVLSSAPTTRTISRPLLRNDPS